MTEEQPGTELRQRKGASSSTSAGEDDKSPETPEELRQRFSDTIHYVLAERARQQGRGTTKEEIDRAVQEDLERINKQQDGPLPGIKDETKKAKDALAADAYNLDKIIWLGEEYLKEDKYLQAMNVLIRGWKRAAQANSEIEDREERFQYLFRLCECSMECKKYKQADAILKDVEVFAMPEDKSDRREYYTMECKIQCFIDQMQKALKAFNNALENCEGFDEAASVWARTMTCLKKVEAYEPARSVMERKAETEDQKKKLKNIDSMNEIKETLENVKPTRTSNYMMLILAVALLSLFVYLLWWLEGRSLQALKLKQ